MLTALAQPFLRIPPFPRSRVTSLARPGVADVSLPKLADVLRQARVGGTFWGPHTSLSPHHKLVLVPDNTSQLQEMLSFLDGQSCTIVRKPGLSIPQGHQTTPACPDPWHLAQQANAIWADANQDIALVCALLDKPVRIFGSGPFEQCGHDPLAALASTVAQWRYVSPFDGNDWSAFQAIEQLAEWRKLIDGNRSIEVIYGVASWKRVTVDALLWNGANGPRYSRHLPDGKGGPVDVASWKSRTSPALLKDLARQGHQIREVEDGFIRSQGLGANCVPPLSIIVDTRGVYFDPETPSDLETTLETQQIDSTLCERASALCARLIEASISKYSSGSGAVDIPSGGKRRVLVIGQVEDDRSMISGGRGISNLELLSRARTIENDAWIVYKPHPDVEAGHRKGNIPDEQILNYADHIERTCPVSALISAVDRLHVITSLAGFEALIRGKSVITHGVPFYAGWGLTQDLCAMSPRRTRTRSLNELVAATLLLYPRYIDPVTRLPCPAEIVIERMAKGEATVTSYLVLLREWQGKLQAVMRTMFGGR